MLILIMKKVAFLFALLLAGTFVAAQNTTLKVTFKFINIVAGYDHACKSEVFIDGKSVGISPVVKESKGTSFTVTVPTGEHDFRLMNFANYENNWEEHTVENNYSIDCFYEDNGHSFGAKAGSLHLIFDIDKQTYYVWDGKLKVKKIKGSKTKGGKVDGVKVKTTWKYEVVNFAG